MDSNPTEKSSPNQLDHGECMKLLQLVLDNEATPQEKEVFEKQVCNCMPYFEIYQVDKAIKSLVKKTCCGKDMPNDLADAIRSKLSIKED